MLFNSFHFLVFFVVVVAANFLMPPRWRWALLLVASYYFYMCWEPAYLVLILGATTITYGCGIAMGRKSSRSARRPYLVASLLSCLGILFAFKYFNFFSESVHSVFLALGFPYRMPALRVLLPVGISFYTFQSLSYVIDVYRGDREPERHFGIYALYVSFFPQLVAGPIERSTRLLPQLRETTRFDYDRLLEGLTLMLWGFFKKVVIADRLALYVQPVYGDPAAYEGAPLILATYFFAFQIYCDFSGYSDIAIGAARVLGYDLMDNFRQPYLSRSIPEFWRRWHISLSTWFRDYVYIPLGGNRVSARRWCSSIMVVFVLSGLWHGANWTFVIWGALHGFFMLASRASAGVRARLGRALRAERYPRLVAGVQVLLTFHLVLFSWVFFRANSLSDALIVLRNAARIAPASVLSDVRLPEFGSFQLMLAFACIGVLELVHYLQKDRSPRYLLGTQPVWIRWPFYQGLILAIAFFGVFEHTAFIYFQF